MNLIQKIFICVSAFFLACVLVYGGWHLEKWVNRYFGYEAEVNEAIAPLENSIRSMDEKYKSLNAV